MSSAYKPIGVDSAVVFQREDADYGAAVSIKVNAWVSGVPVSSVFSRPLLTEEIGEIAAHCALIYYRRTGKMPRPPCAPPFKIVEFSDGQVSQFVNHDEPDTAACAHCLDECTGECL